MPHSSGGGSSSGGSHGGSSSSSGGRSAHQRFGNSYYTGSHRYVYYVDGRPRYYFSDQPYTRDIASRSKINDIVGGAIWIVASLAALVFMGSSLIHIPTKVAMDYDTAIVIDDAEDVLEPQEEEAMRDSFLRFQDGTGVTPAFVSVSESAWRDRAQDLEIYAYRTYVDRFADEKHWLVIFVPGDGREQWRWEGMIGDECGGMITAELEESFTKKVQENLWASSRYTVQEAISAGFDDILAGSQRVSIDPDAPLVVGVMLVGCVIGIGQLLRGLRTDPSSDPRIQSYRCATDKKKPEEVRCAYCDSIYAQGAHTNCPNCGAALP